MPDSSKTLALKRKLWPYEIDLLLLSREILKRHWNESNQTKYDFFWDSHLNVQQLLFKKLSGRLGNYEIYGSFHISKESYKNFKTFGFGSGSDAAVDINDVIDVGE